MTLESLVTRTGWLEPEIRATAQRLAARGMLRIVFRGQSFVVAPVAPVEACGKGRGLNLLPEEARAKEQIERQFVQSGLSAPEVGRVLAGLSVDRRRAGKMLQLLLRERTLIRINKEFVFHSDAVKQLLERLAEYKRTRGANLPVGEFKQLTGVSRKYAIPLLEYFDRERVTRREGDSRVIL